MVKRLMVRFKNLFYKQTLLGEKTTIGQISLTPQCQAFMICWRHGGALIVRPVAVLVERDGEVERIRIINVTRMSQLGLLGLGLIFSLIILLMQYSTRTMVERKDR